MAQNLPATSTEVSQRMNVDVQRELKQSNPFFGPAWLRGIIVGLANRFFDFYHSLQEAAIEALPDTAEDNISRWALIYGIIRLPGTAANGNIIATGLAGTLIPSLTVFKVGELFYRSQSNATIGVEVVSVTLSTIGTTATAVSASPHTIASNVKVTIAGANESDYNGTHDVIVTGESTFTFTVVSGIGTPATGIITATFTRAIIAVASDETGANQNQELDTIFSLESSISNMDDDAWVDFGEISNGEDQESDDSLKSRMLERIRNPIAHFSVSEIIFVTKTVNGVTRVWVDEITPAIGQVTIYFTRDADDDGPIPSGSEVAEVKAVLIVIKPANTADADVIVAAPTAVATNFTFSDLSPNTASMQAAVTANLEQFFAEEPEVSIGVDADAYRAAIKTTVDTATGDIVSTFTLTPDPGDITIASGELATLGTITYP